MTQSRWPQESHLSSRNKLQRQFEKRNSERSMPKRPDALRTELSEEAAQRFQYLEHQQNIFAQARLRTVESALGCEYASAQQNLQQQYLTQVQGLHNELQTAQRQFEESISQERASNGQELDALRRELADKNQLIREQANDLQQDEKLRREWQTITKLES